MNALFEQPGGKPEVDLGIHPDMSNEAYHGAPGISNSGLTLIGQQSPAHYYGRRLDPNRPVETSKAGQETGTIAHCAILEPDAFGQRYTVSAEKMNRNTKAWKEFAAQAEADGKTAIQPDQYDMAWRMHDSVRSIEDLRSALEQQGLAEASAFWVDEATGELCKCRPDYAAEFPAGDLLLDVKTYSSAAPGEFARQIGRKKYHSQAAFYQDGWAQVTGTKILGFLFIAVEIEYPHVASAIMLDEESVESGRIFYRRALDTFAECRKNNIWPGYGSGVEVVSLPHYFMEKTAI